MEVIAKRYKTKIIGMYFGQYHVVTTMNYELSKELLVREEFQGRPDTIITRTRGLGDLLGKQQLYERLLCNFLISIK